MIHYEWHMGFHVAVIIQVVHLAFKAELTNIVACISHLVHMIFHNRSI